MLLTNNCGADLVIEAKSDPKDKVRISLLVKFKISNSYKKRKFMICSGTYYLSNPNHLLTLIKFNLFIYVIHFC